MSTIEPIKTAESSFKCAQMCQDVAGAINKHINDFRDKLPQSERNNLKSRSDEIGNHARTLATVTAVNLLENQKNLLN